MSVAEDLLKEVGKVSDWMKELRTQFGILERDLSRLQTSLDNYKDAVRMRLDATDQRLSIMEAKEVAAGEFARESRERLGEVESKVVMMTPLPSKGARNGNSRDLRDAKKKPSSKRG